VVSSSVRRGGAFTVDQYPSGPVVPTDYRAEMRFVEIAAGLSVAALAALWTVSVIGWLRTRPLRRGKTSSPRAARPRPAQARTSHATYLPGLAGVLLAVTGLLAAARGSGTWPLALTLVGLAIAWAGFAARVTALEVDANGFLIRYRARRPFALTWSEVRSLTPPRWPLGGWRVAGTREGRMLMASDLFGFEDLLEQTIIRASLRYEEGGWRTP
jgi:hypothetical protein